MSEKTNRIYVSDLVDGTFYVIDGATDRVINGPVALGQGAGAYGSPVLDDVNDVAYIPTTGIGPAGVIALDLKTMKPIGAPVTIGAPWLPPGCFWAPGFPCTTYGDTASAGPIDPASHTIYASGASNYVIQSNSMNID